MFCELKMRRKCRVWWPKKLSSCKPESTLLFGWFVDSCSTLIDIVVAIAVFPDKHLSSQSDLEGIIHYTNGKMPLFLQDKSTFSFLGHCAADYSFNEQLQSVGMEKDGHAKTANHETVLLQHNKDLTVENFGQWSCGCQKLEKFLEQSRHTCIRNANWIQLAYSSHEYALKEITWIPKLHHMHWKGQLVSSCDVHIIIYEPPFAGVHHFSLRPWASAEQGRASFKRHKLFDELQQKPGLPDLDTVIQAINCATPAQTFFERCIPPKTSLHRSHALSMLVTITWNLMAMLVASFSTLFYIILQLFYIFLSYGSQSVICTMLAKVFNRTWKNIHIRSCQLLYWPIFLQNSGFRSQSSVEYAHKVSLYKHSMWSSIAIDVLLGNIVCFPLLVHTEAACSWVLTLVHGVTNNFLRSGCAWLMGVPAGFKLNTELAGILGMISLNVIQIWSTLWFFMGFLLRYFIKGLALSGIIMGLTIPAALVIDIIMLATLHVSTLHGLISLIYSQQIQALAALWRLFRGRKLNPLRQRLDSYDYTVEQHVVGSLLFAPLLLILPTTSIFYIFFTILNSSISFTCILVEVSVSILHATPYAEIFLWMVKGTRFPSGIWFEIISGQIDSPETECVQDGYSPSGKLLQRKMEPKNNEKAGILVSFLRSNFANLGQIVLPHYRNVFRGLSESSVSSSVFRVLLGKRFPSALETALPSTMPWIFITHREYWQLCRDSILTCMENYNYEGFP